MRLALLGRILQRRDTQRLDGMHKIGTNASLIMFKLDLESRLACRQTMVAGIQVSSIEIISEFVGLPELFNLEWTA